MIVGAARCMEQCFGGMGRLYRIGGDEYAAILTSVKDGSDALLPAFEETMRSWSESSNMQLTASCGCVSASELPGDAVYSREFHALVKTQCRHDPGHTLRDHRLPCSGRPRHQEVMLSRRGYLRGPPRRCLSRDL